ncbi:leucine-rich repeat domain-containing protein [Listeria cornellensis]|uniref:Internalin A n=1 Tax=Listeria cornellensis FSL F6-0969 TaxID=1265820 RepID=W7BLU6_9LIST|nr:leucine-rich repeat domain-containing protein [Listeria cornellensis]EUJ24011.1 Internalin A [Listeria cornellensis FSL F6-0969]
MKKLKSSIAVLSIVGLCLPSVVIGMPVVAETTVEESAKSTKLGAEADPSETKPLLEWIEDPWFALYIAESLGVSRTANVSRATLENRKTLILSDEYDPIKIKSMKGLENFKNLTRLSFFGGEVQDYSPLNDLHQLTSLTLGHFNGMKLDFIKEMPLLKNLVIYDSPLTDISALASLKSLTHLAVNRAQVKDISVINQMPSLGFVGFDGNQIEEIPTLQNSDQMHNLSLNQNKIKSVEGLKGLDALITLSITDNQVETLAPLRGLTGLQELIAMRNKIQTMEGINEMTGLQELNLVRNELMEVMPVTNLKALKELYADGNHISNITPWKEMSDAVDWGATGQTFDIPIQKIGIGESLIIPNIMVDREGGIISYIEAFDKGIFNPDLNQMTWDNLQGEGSVDYFFRDNSTKYAGVVTVPYEVVARKALTFNQTTDEESIPSQAILFGDKATEPAEPTKKRIYIGGVDLE